MLSLTMHTNMHIDYAADMNSRRVKAGRELTGDSGILREVSDP